MLNKALLMSPKEFRVSIGTQSNCTASVNKQSAMPGDVVTVTVRATTGHGNTQVGVSPSVSVSKVNETTFTFVMPFTDVVVSASASALDFRINVSQTGSGTVNVKPIAKYGERVTVSVSAANLYELKSISASGVSLSGGGNTWTFTMPARDVAITVVFAKIVVEITIGKGSSNNNGTDYSVGYDSRYGCGSINRIPYWNYKNKKAHLIYVGYVAIRDKETHYWDFGPICGLEGVLFTVSILKSFTITFHDGKKMTFDTYGSGSEEIIRNFAKYIGTKAQVTFSRPPDGYL